jgi:hypothetical protein
MASHNSGRHNAAQAGRRGSETIGYIHPAECD